MALIKLNDRAVSNATTFGSISSLGEMVFISKATASSSASIEFTSGINSTYKEYVFYFYDIHPSTDQTSLLFQANTVGGSGFNETITSTTFQAQHSESGVSELSYEGGMDQAQGTSFQKIAHELGNDNDQTTSGFLHLYNPSSTTYVKHFIAESQSYRYNDYSHRLFTAGYFNTISAIDQIQFKMDSGNIDAGSILMFGIN